MAPPAEPERGAEAFAFAPAAPADFERLLAIRLLAMRESLERLGRFHPDRSRAWFAEHFRPERTRLISVHGELTGCVSLFAVAPGEVVLEHFYLHPDFQGRGLGARVLSELLAEADRRGARVRLTVLQDSRAQGLYRRFGFREVGRDGVDLWFERPGRQ